MKRNIKRFLLLVLWAIALVLSAHARAGEAAMNEWKVAVGAMGDLRKPLEASSLAHGAAAIERARSIGGSTERECELIDAVAQFYHRHGERPHDERLVHYERALSRSRAILPDDGEIAAMHRHVSVIALTRARERAEANYLAQATAPAPKPRRVGYVASMGGVTFDAFREGLRAAGYTEGKDIVIETRFTEGRNDRFPALVAELLESKVDVLLAGSPPGAIAAIKADTTTPIVIAGVSDPMDLAKSLRRPAGHITGTSLGTDALGGKWIAMLKEASPGLTRTAILVNPNHPSRERWMRDMGEQARALKLEVAIHEASDAASLEKALAAIEASDAQGLVVTGDPAFVLNRDKVIATVERRRLPAVYFSKLFADSGGLLAYGGSLEDSYRRAPAYIDRILKGAKPSDLPVEPAGIELVVNQKAAKKLGIALPQSLVRRADKVIE